MSKFKTNYDIGYTSVSKDGFVYKVIYYSGRKDIGIKFEDGRERSTTSTAIKYNRVTYPKCLSKPIEVGDVFKTKQGKTIEIVKVKPKYRYTVRFEDGYEQDYGRGSIISGNINPNKLISVGDVFSTNNSGDVTVVEYINAHKVIVKFEDGLTNSVQASCLRLGTVAHPTGGMHIGDAFTNSDGCRGKVYKFYSQDNISVMWEDGVITHGHRAVNVRRGSIYYPNFKSVVGIGYFGVGKYKPNKSGRNKNYNDVVYRKWVQMIVRCYNPYEINKGGGTAYKDVFVCTEWHNFQNFALWADEHIDKFIDGFELDKDMFGSGYLYSPEYCTLLPDKVNGFLSNNYSNKVSGLPDGVNVIEPNKDYPNAKIGYVARCHIDGKRKYLGYYNTPEEAGEAYRVAKEGEAKRLAEEYRDILTTEEYVKLKNFKLSDIHRK